MSKGEHTTNYMNTFIVVADDCPTSAAQVPPQKVDSNTVANLHFDMVAQFPYRYTSDDVIFGAYASKNNLTTNLDTERALFFSKGQPCLRCSPLTKRYGWGVHSDADGKVAIYPVESVEYARFASDKELKQVKAMRSKKG